MMRKQPPECLRRRASDFALAPSRHALRRTGRASPDRTRFGVQDAQDPLRRGYQSILALCSLLLFCAPAQAADMQTVLKNLSSVIVPATIMVLTISYACGIYFMIIGLMALKKLGNFATQQSQPGDLKEPMAHVIIGAILIYLPSTSSVMGASFLGANAASLFGTNGGLSYASLGMGASLLGYVGADTLSQQWASIANTLVLYIQFLGLLSFVRGWFILAESAAHSAQQGGSSKGVTHIIGGIIAMNFVPVVNIINNTISGG